MRGTLQRRPLGFSATSTSRSCPSRGVSWGSGLEPPPHLVGERARALDVLAAGGLVSASATALAEGMPHRRRARRRSASHRGDEPGIESLAEHLALAGYERVDQAQERGQFALRGGIIDVYPDDRPRAAAHRALRRRDREHPRLLAFHAAHAASGRRGDHLPGRRAPARPRRAAPLRRRGRGPARSRRSRRPRSRRAGPRLAAGRGARRSGRRSSSRPFRSSARSSSTRCRPASRSPSRRSDPRSQRAGSPRPRTSSARSFAAACAPPSPSRIRARRCAPEPPAPGRARLIEPGEELPDEAELLFAVSPARRGFVWRELGLALLPDTQVFRRRAASRRAPRRPRAPVVRRAADGRLRRPRGSRRRQAARLRDEGDRRRHARLPSARLPRRGPAVRPPRAGRQGLALHRRRRKRAGALEARRQGVAHCSRPAPARRSASSPAS